MVELRNFPAVFGSPVRRRIYLLSRTIMVLNQGLHYVLNYFEKFFQIFNFSKLTILEALSTYVNLLGYQKALTPTVQYHLFWTKKNPSHNKNNNWKLSGA